MSSVGPLLTQIFVRALLSDARFISEKSPTRNASLLIKNTDLEQICSRNRPDLLSCRSRVVAVSSRLLPPSSHGIDWSHLCLLRSEEAVRTAPLRITQLTAASAAARGADHCPLPRHRSGRGPFFRPYYSDNGPLLPQRARRARRAWPLALAASLRCRGSWERGN